MIRTIVFKDVSRKGGKIKVDLNMAFISAKDVMKQAVKKVIEKDRLSDIDYYLVEQTDEHTLKELYENDDYLLVDLTDLGYTQYLINLSKVAIV